MGPGSVSATSTHMLSTKGGARLKNHADRVIFPLGASHLLVVSAFFFFYLLLGLFPLLLQLVLLLLIPLLLGECPKNIWEWALQLSLEGFPSSKAPCTMCCKTFFMSDHLESKVFAPQERNITLVSCSFKLGTCDGLNERCFPLAPVFGHLVPVSGAV